MLFKKYLCVLGAMSCVAFAPEATAQFAYKCGPRSYSEMPCAKRAMDLDEAPVPVNPNPRGADLRRAEQNRVLARNLRRAPGESESDFAVRRQRARLMPEDSAECARLDTRLPFEQARIEKAEPQDISTAQASLAQTKKRYGQLRC